MSEEVETTQNLNVPEIDHSKRNGATDDEDDIFKSAMEVYLQNKILFVMIDVCNVMLRIRF